MATVMKGAVVMATRVADKDAGDGKGSTSDSNGAKQTASPW
jgi:hypothetical protein